MNECLRIRGQTFSPALFLAPMAGISHGAFRRLVSELGGCGALFTEMIPLRLLARKDGTMPAHAMKRPDDAPTIYQLLLSGPEGLSAAIARLAALDPAGIDINLACPAPEVVRLGGGTALVRDPERCAAVLREARTCWSGLLTVKCRLGDEAPDWRDILRRRLALFTDCGIDALIVHPRFSGEKLKRRARWEELAWIARESGMPLVGSGDVISAADLQDKCASAPSVRAVMIGRMAAVQPWIFREVAVGPSPVDYREIWDRFCRYVCDDTPAPRAIGRIKLFSAYYARNFFFGHEFFRLVRSSTSLEQALDRADRFLSNRPQTVAQPSVAGI